MFGLSNKSTVNIEEKAINELMTRGVEDVFVKESLETKLRSGKQLRVKLGFDPTGGKIHIGRAVILWKLKAFQDLGHQIIFLVGDFTAKIGDPSDKLEKRPMLTDEAIQENLKNYKAQVGKVIAVSRAEFRFNSEWLSKLGFAEIAELAESFSVPQMSNRRNFKERLEKGGEVSLREFLYPLMQGYDSYALKADVEIGGFDQLFNLKAGRIIQKHYGQLEQDILITSMVEGTDGRKMSTSWGNVINIVDEPSDMFGKVMSLKDELIEKYFLLCTDVSILEAKAVKADLLAGKNPRDLKLSLAEKITARYHGNEKATAAKNQFLSVFSSGKLPENIKEVLVSADELLGDILLREKLVASKSEFRRLVSEGAVSDPTTKEKITDPFFKISKNFTVRVGPLRYLKINI